MNQNIEIYNWLMMAFSEPYNSLTESFFYDRRDKTFYSIHFVDYGIFNDDLTINQDSFSSYSKQTVGLLADRIKRREVNDPTIVSIDRIPLEERKQAMKQFVLAVEDNALAETLYQRIENLDLKSEFDFHFEDEVNEQINNNWTRFKTNYLTPKIDTFLNLNNIDVETAFIWDVGEKFSVTIKLDDHGKKAVGGEAPAFKPWWKFW